MSEIRGQRSGIRLLVILIIFLAPVSGLTAILSDEDKKLYKEVFELQKEAKWETANQKIILIKNRILLGYVLGDRYLNPKYPLTKEDLAHWRKYYSDIPIKLSLKNYSKELTGFGASSGQGKALVSKAQPGSWKKRSQGEKIWNSIIDALQDNKLDRGYSLIYSSQAKQYLKSYELDALKVTLAQHYFARGNDSYAYQMASQIAKSSGKVGIEANWVSGIAAWRLGSGDIAVKHFINVAESRAASSWDRAAGGFWAFRYFYEHGDKYKATKYLEIAADYPRTFYGILARTILKQDLGLKFESFTSTEEDLKSTFIERLIALAEVGRIYDAEKELRVRFIDATLRDKKQMMMIAHYLGLADVELRMASYIAEKHGEYHDNSLYPIPRWIPQESLKFNAALVYAIMRQESGFSPYVESPMGAKGIMQVMPGTADLVAKVNHKESVRNRLYYPKENIEAGQEYLKYLSEQSYIGRHLFFILTGYNAGHGRVLEWQRTITFGQDPLLFLESIPFRETRSYVEEVAANYWIYREKLGLPNPSIMHILKGNWPGYDSSV